MEAFLKLPRFSFNLATIQHAPQKPGVYGIFRKLELIYIGSTDQEHPTIQGCLASHGAGASGECTTNGTRYTWEMIAVPLPREKALLARYRELHDRYPRCNERLTAKA